MKGCAVLCLATAGILAVAAAPAQAQGVATGEAAPDFSLPDSAGKEHRLADYKGKHVVLEWINYGCPFVRKHYQDGAMQALQKKYTGKGAVWLAICSSAPGKQGHFNAAEIAKQNQDNSFSATAYLVDADGKVGKMFGARRTPHMFVVDPEGKVVYQGAIDSISSADAADVSKAENYVAQCLDACLAGRPSPVETTKPYGCSVKY